MCVRFNSYSLQTYKFTKASLGIGSKPQCSNCKKSDEQCEWRQPLKFRPENAFTIDEDNSLTDNQHRATSVAGHGDDPTAASPIVEPIGHSMPGPPPAKRRRATFSQSEPSMNHEIPIPLSPVLPIKPGLSARPSSGGSSAGVARPEGLASHASPSGRPVSRPGSSSLAVTGQLSPTAQFHLSPVQTHTSPSVNSDTLKSDGIFLPGSEYQDLHTLFRNGMLNTAFNDPVPPLPTPGGNGVIVDGSFSESPHASKSQMRHIHLTGDDHLTPELEGELWQNWFNEVSTWVSEIA